MAPPADIVERALRAAAQSPCAKSKRGVVIYERRVPPGPSWEVEDPDAPYASVLADGYNGPPGNIACDGSAACRASCGKRCVHAEVRAIRESERVLGRDGDWGVNTLVHVKLGADGKVVAGGGPSCWQCSREILDAGIAFIWLYEAATPADAKAYHAYDPAAGPVPMTLDVPLGVWRRYTAEEFHAATCRACEVY